MRKILSVLLLAALLVTMVALPVSAQSVAPAVAVQSPRDDVIVLYDGSYEQGGIFKLQFCYIDDTEVYQDTEFYLQGDSSTMVNVSEFGGSFPQGQFAFAFILTLDEIASVSEYPISELSVYNHMDTGEQDKIQVNYVDPDNEHGYGDDSYNKSFELKNVEPGWQLLQHKVTDSALNTTGLNPDNIDHVRISWITDTENYSEIDWTFDCLILAKQSFYDDRTAAQQEMNALVEALEVPTAETLAELEDDIVGAKEKLEDNLYEFPNFMIENQDKLNEVWNAYLEIKAQDAANIIFGKIDALGEITLENYETKKAEIEAIDTEISTYTSNGYKKSLITNLDTLEAARDAVEYLTVEAAIDALPAVDTVTEEDTAEIEQVKSALETLSADQQAMIPAEKIEKLNALLAKLEKLKGTVGDINEDGSIDASDALMALQHSVKLITLEDTAFEAADVDDSNAVDATDALMILQASVKLIKPEDFPAAK